jgi:hypothetical protein
VVSKIKDKSKGDATRDESEDTEDTDSEVGSSYVFYTCGSGHALVPRRTVMIIVP